MPKQVMLYNQHIAVEKGTEIDGPASEKEGAPVVREMFTIILTDKSYGDQIRISFTKDVRDDIVKQLTGGIVLSGGI